MHRTRLQRSESVTPKLASTSLSAPATKGPKALPSTIAIRPSIADEKALKRIGLKFWTMAKVGPEMLVRRKIAAPRLANRAT